MKKIFPVKPKNRYIAVIKLLVRRANLYLPNFNFCKFLSQKYFVITNKLMFCYKTFKDYIEGDFAYENYLKHHNKYHKNTSVLDKKAFLKQAQKAKWNKINRCC